jgi:hypothetical protein
MRIGRKLAHTEPSQGTEVRDRLRLLYAVAVAACAILLLAVPEDISAAGATGQSAWTARAVPHGIDTLNDVVCPSSSHCYAVGGDGTTGSDSIIGSVDGGDHWSRLMTTPQGVQLGAIACPIPSTCLVAGEINPPGTSHEPSVEVNPPAPIPATLEAFLTTDDGAHWSSEALPKGIFGVEDEACPSVKVCVVIGSVGIDRTTNGGTTWVMEKMPSHFFEIGPVACPTRSFCVVGGTGGASSSLASVSEDGGATWSSAVVVAGPVHPNASSIDSTSLGAVTCSSDQHCVALVGDGSLSGFGTGSPIVTLDAGGRWKRGSSSVGWTDSCVENFCVSVGGHLHLHSPASSALVTTGDAFISTDFGEAWRPSSIPTRLIPTAVSCTSPTHCVAVGGNLPKAKSAVIMTYS